MNVFCYFWWKFINNFDFRYYRLLLVEHFENFAESLGLAFLDSSTENYFINFTKTVLLNKDHSLVQRLQKLLVGRKVCMRKNDLYKKSADNEIYTYGKIIFLFQVLLPVNKDRFFFYYN